MKAILIVGSLFLLTACNAPTTKTETAARACCSTSEANCSMPDSKDPGAVCKMETASPMDSVTQKISPEELAQLYTANKTKLGPKCFSAASAYCGKVTRDLRITQTEFSCLWTKVFRVSREILPLLDNTDCAKMIKDLAKK